MMKLPSIAVLCLCCSLLAAQVPYDTLFCGLSGRSIDTGMQRRCLAHLGHRMPGASIVPVRMSLPLQHIGKGTTDESDRCQPALPGNAFVHAVPPERAIAGSASPLTAVVAAEWRPPPDVLLSTCILRI